MRLRIDYGRTVFLLFIALFIVFLIYPYWTDLKLVPHKEMDELFFLDRDVGIYNNQSLCFNFISSSGEADVFISNQSLGMMKSGEVCGSAPYGKFNVTVRYHDKKIWYIAEKINESIPEITNSNIFSFSLPIYAEQYSVFNVSVTLSNGKNKARVFLMPISLDNEVIRQVPVELDVHESRKIDESFRITECGEHILRIDFDSAKVERNIDIQCRQNSNFLFGFILLFLPFYIIFRRRSLLTRVSLTMAFSLVYLVLASALFDVLNISLYYSIFILLFIMLVISVVKR